MSPLPVAAQVPPSAPVQAHVQVSGAGNASVTIAPVAPLGPALRAAMVYVTLPPGVALATPSVLVIESCASGPSASMSKSELLPGTGSVVPAGAATVAVFTRAPPAAAEIAQVAVYATLPPAGRFT